MEKMHSRLEMCHLQQQHRNTTLKTTNLLKLIKLIKLTGYSINLRNNDYPYIAVLRIWADSEWSRATPEEEIVHKG